MTVTQGRLQTRTVRRLQMSSADRYIPSAKKYKEKNLNTCLQK